MGLMIKRSREQRTVKCLLHRIGDIPGGVGVAVANLGGSVLYEGTPLGKGAGDLYEVCKTAKVLTKAEASATTYEVAKGHHFKIGDRFATAECNGQEIASIDRTDDAKDIITVKTSLGKVVAAGTCAFESKGADTKLKVTPIAVAGSDQDVNPGDNLFVSAWVVAVVLEANAPAANDAIKSALKCVAYV